MKKIFTTMFFIMITAFLSFLIAAPIVNDSIAKKTAAELANLPLPDHTELVESVYQAGKLIGNGNGMQYFGALLIKSNLPLEELKKYYSNFAENEWDCIVEQQMRTEINVIEHGNLAFQTEIAGDNYYIVYSWGDNDTIFHDFDIRGH